MHSYPVVQETYSGPRFIAGIGSL